MRWGIRLQVLLLALVPTLTISALLVAYFTSTRIEDLENAFKMRGEAIALMLSSNAQKSVATRNNSELENLGLQILNERDVKGLAFYSEKGELLAVSGKLSKAASELALSDKKAFNKAIDNSLVFVLPIFNQKTIKNSGKLLGWIKLEIDATSIYLNEYQILIHTSLILLLGLSISGLNALQMGRNVTRPILELAEAIERVKHGDLSIRVRSSTYRELQVLESGINTMVETIQDAQVELQRRIDKATLSLRRSLETIEEQNIELEIARQEAVNASQIKSKFLADMSHEIRTPLNGVMGFINLLKRTKLNETQEDYITIIQKSARTLLSIINDILDISKIEAGKLTIKQQPMNLRECLEDALTLLVPQSAAKSLSLVPKIANDVPNIIIGDPLRLRQVVTNLVNNAIKFTEKGSVTISVSLVDRSLGEETSLGNDIIKIAVTDTGIGISEEQQKELFQAFHQVMTEQDHRIEGTGLGLVICKKLVEQMKGKIGLISEIGKGSTFWFTFEAPKVLENKVLPKLTEQKTLENHIQSVRILAVDDNMDNLKLIDYLLKEKGIKILTVNSGEAAIQAVKKDRFDIIFMDIRMPGMNGIEATKAIRQYEKESNFQSTPIIALTAHALISEQEALFKSGIDDYLTKPIEEDHFDLILQKWLKNVIASKDDAQESFMGDVQESCKDKENSSGIEEGSAMINEKEKRALAKQTLFQELFEKLCQTIPDDLTRIHNAYLEENYEALRDEVHRLHGATCYCDVPKLKNFLKDFESMLAKGEQGKIIEEKIINLKALVKEIVEVA